MAARRKAIAELKENRASGKTRLAAYKIEELGQVYEEVDEEGYNKVVRARLDQDDFVIDDNGEGYADDGREDWLERQQGDGSESEREIPLKGKAAKRKREEDKEKKERQEKGISNYFSAGPIAPIAKPKPVATAEDAAFLADLLGEVDQKIPIRNPIQPIRTIRSAARRKTRLLSPSVSHSTSRLPKREVSDEAYLPHTPPIDTDLYSDGPLPVMNHDDIQMSDQLLPSSPIVKAIQRKKDADVKREPDEDEEDLMEIARAVGGVASKSVNISGSRPIPKANPKAYPSPESSSPTHPPAAAAADVLDPSVWNDVTTKLNLISSSPQVGASFGKLDPKDAIEEDGSLRMFWTDYTEVNGSLCLFGKVKNRSTGDFVSCFLKIDNILRKLFFLPREKRYRHGRETEEEVEMKDVYEEVDDLMTRLRVSMHKIKPCTRKYAFELPDVPKEADYLKLLYPYDKAVLPIETTGETFQRVFGTNTALFEQFVLWRDIKGPCWLKVEGANFDAIHSASHCKLEVQVSKPGLVTTLDESDDLQAPPLTLMSIAMRTTLNVKDNTQEILMLSARIYENVSLKDTTAPEKLPCKTLTVIRPYGKAFPIGFEAETKQHRGAIQTASSEQGLLSVFLAKLAQVDPDVLMGHQLEGVDYPILLSRMRERNTPGWHKIGRMKRSAWPKNMGKLGGSFWAERQLVSGRLLCDLANDMGKSLMTKCQNFSLTEMCEIQLGSGNTRREIDNEVALKTWAQSREGLMNYLSHCETDTYFIAAIAIKLQMLPLTKVLTNLAGNSWARTLSGTRAERNEYILLHEFHKHKYICPDKIFGKSRGRGPEDEDADEAGEGKKRSKFTGGLVFEPERGLYDKFVLVMDFNSLYPSIIQEFNICFTTVDRPASSTTSSGLEDDKVPELPVEQAQGILPRLIATLVNRRRAVKSLMKDPRTTPAENTTYDIKQLALKLTANSMYGCLGYTKSRFYARPLAMLTTYKGREILLSTRELAESHQLQVIYGDTDSVMINTNADNLADARKIGNDFKRAVNERYKLLEIDIDNFFRRLLLHAKKKYAAINMVQVDGKYVDVLEVKGLDMKRREYCALSKEISGKLLNEILSGEESELVVTRVHEHLREVAEKMREGAIPVQKYIIYTKLGKHPKDYPNADSMPQVQVALRAMAAGKTVRVNDVMSYIITTSTTTPNASEPAAKRAYAPQDVMKADSGLIPDIEYYLHKQLYPPIERLCAPISGTSPLHLASCLGLDTRKFGLSSASSSNNAALEITPLESQLSDADRFADCLPLSLRCRHCRASSIFAGLAASPNLVSPEGITCGTPSCGRVMANLTVVAQVEHQIRQVTAKYYEGWVVCDESGCGNRSRQISVYGRRCLGPKGLGEGCLGRMGYETGEKAVWNQLLCWGGLWDVDKAKQAAQGEAKERVAALAEHNRRRFATVKAVIDGYLDKCGRQWVQMDSLFGFQLNLLT